MSKKLDFEEFKYIFLKKATRNLLIPKKYRAIASKFINQYHHLPNQKFLKYRKYFENECKNENQINYCHCYLPSDFTNDFYHLIKEIKNCRKWKFQTVRIEAIYILESFLDDYKELFFDSNITIYSMQNKEKEMDESEILQVIEDEIDSNKSVPENYKLIKEKFFINDYWKQYDIFIIRSIQNYFLINAVKKLPKEEYEKLIKFCVLPPNCKFGKYIVS